MKRKCKLLHKLRGLHRLSRLAIAVGATLMTCFYIIAAAACLLAPNAADYLYAMSIHYGALECAPACFASGVCAGLLGDLMLRRHSDEDPSDSP